MRRIFAYVAIAASVLVATGVTANAVLSSVSTDYTYQSGETVGFKLKNKSDENNTLIGADLESDAGKDAAKNMAEEMSRRLTTWGVTAYDITTYGNDTIEVTFSANNNQEYSDIARYLTFSGQNYTIATEDETILFDHESMFKNSVARIEYIDYATIVVIPVSDGAKLKELVDEKLGKTEEAVQTRSQRGAEEGEEDALALYIWSDKMEGDSFEEANTNPYVSKKVLVGLNAENLFYVNSEKENTELQIICGSATEEGYYDINSAAQGYYSAKKLVNMFNAGSLDYDVEIIYAKETTAKVENLVNLGEHSINVAWSHTLIASLIAIAIISVILVLFYKVGSIGAIISTIGTVYATLCLIIGLKTQFTISTLIALTLVAAASIISEIHYLNRIKEEVYHGKSLRKANIEASKHNTMVAVDSSVILIIPGIILYLVGGSLGSSMGIVFIFGAIFNIIFNVGLMKLMMLLVTNSNKLYKKYSCFGVSEKLIVNQMDEADANKTPYEGPYQNRDFTKKSKIYGIISGAVALVGLVMAIVFGVTSGSMYNMQVNSTDYTRIYFELTDHTTEVYSDPNVSPSDVIIDELAKIKVGSAEGKSLKEYLTTDKDGKVTFDFEENQFYSEQTGDYDIDKDYFIFSVKDLNEDSVCYDGNSQLTLKTAVDGHFEALNWADTEDQSIAVKNSKAISAQSLSIWATLGCLFGIVGVAIYFIFRFGISRALASFIVSIGTGFITMCLFIITRVSVPGYISLAAIFTALLALMLMILFANKDRELRKELSARRSTVTREERHNTLVKAIYTAAPAMFVTIIVGCYLGVNFFAFGPNAFALTFGGVVFGSLVAGLLAIMVGGTLSELFEKLFSGINIKPVDGSKRAIKRAEKEKKNKSAEPEESPVIGINI